MIRTFAASTLFLLLPACSMGASISDLTQWTLIQDPPTSGLNSIVGVMGLAGNGVSLFADGAIPSGADIGYASVNGEDVERSTDGFYFDPASDFSVAIDFDFSAINSIGAGGIGFGIGEDIDGRNSAGVGLGFLNGAPLAFASAGRVNDIDQTPSTLVSGFGAGRFFVEYDSDTRDVKVGVNATPGAAAPAVVETLESIQNQWNDSPLLVSLFLRSQAVDPIPALSGGRVNTLFSNFEVLAGTPLSIPEPTATFLAMLGTLGVFGGSHRRSRGSR